MDKRYYNFQFKNPDFDTLGYIIGTANFDDKHDRSAPSDYHWKILKCRMIIFSSSSILACPDNRDLKRVHIIFNKKADDYDKINSMFCKYSLTHDGDVKASTAELFQMCFQYTMSARMAPIWNTLGSNYLINNRDFLTTKGHQEGLKYQIKSNDQTTCISLKPIKIILHQVDVEAKPGEYVRVLPSLNKATVEDCCSSLPKSGSFKSYKDLRRHWKNIHGYRLPEQESSFYYLIQFWRGDPLTYPKHCVMRNFPTVTPVPRSTEKIILSRFISCLNIKFLNLLGHPLSIEQNDGVISNRNRVVDDNVVETQNVSLCTPTQT
ncbi:uncharacterized protein C18orf63-like [Plodia interpunctella]|uniref:uncharacterized protein C18orf63-like n=1 Tax=Plodia interpunctella TaxID=58824 RepID=UPI002368681C|nr:uncharacterized protein C18orf63-like [Plodia interpunctella]